MRPQAHLRRIAATVATAFLATALTSGTTAHAAVPSEVNIRLSASDKAGMDNKTETWCKDNANSWCPYNKGVGTYVKFVIAGDALSLTYTVTDMAGNPVTNTLVTLNRNIGGGSFTGSFTGTTDSNGRVTFTLQNTVNASAAEPYPVAPSSMTNWDSSRQVSPEVKYDFTPTIGAALEHADWVWTHTVKPQNWNPGTPAPAVANIRLSAEDKVSMTDKSYWWTDEPQSFTYVKFVVAGDTLTLRYRVTDGSNKAVANIPVSLMVSNPKRASFSGSTSANTDANGYATFTLTNTTSPDDAEPYPTAPSNINYWDDSRGRSLAFESTYEFTPTVGAATQHIDRIWTHTVQPASDLPLPSKVNIRLASSMVDPNWNAYEATDWLGNAAGLGNKAYIKYVDAGATLNLTYRATNAATGDPVANKAITLTFNAQSDPAEQTSWTSSGTSVGAGAKVTLTSQTDASGYATFSVRNTNSAAAAEPAPPAWNVVNPSWTASPKVELKGSLTPSLGAATEVVDYLWPHITKSGGAITSATLPAAVNIRLMSPALDTTTNAYDASGWVAQWFALGTKAFVQYVPVGSAMTLTYKVSDSAGNAMAGTAVRLKVNAPADKALRTSFLAGNLVVAAGQPVYLKGTTNDNGLVTFTMTNTNVNDDAEPVPAVLSQPNPSWTANPAVELGSNIQVTVGAGSEVTDIYFPHFTKVTEQVTAGTPGAPTLTSVVAGNAKLTINFTAGTAGSGGATKYYGYTLDGGKTWVDSSKNTKSPILLTTGIVNGTTYLVKVRAWNVKGPGYSSSMISASPKADPPGAPTLSGVTAGAGQLSLAFKAPSSNGGAAISKYQYSFDAGKSWTDLAGLTSPAVVTGLGYGVAYSVTLRAVNSSGAGAASGAKSATTTKLAQTITFPALSAMKVGGADQALAASASSGLAITYTAAAANVCTIVGGKLRAVGKGSCTVTANQAGDSRYAAAKAVAVKVTITL
ncbi:MAG: Ig-like domain-containing protein [Actinomycetales bacterium]|nr:Ig-like domain-containing protein [Actinomycetales bacterium]